MTTIQIITLNSQLLNTDRVLRVMLTQGLTPLSTTQYNLYYSIASDTLTPPTMTPHCPNTLHTPNQPRTSPHYPFNYTFPYQTLETSSHHHTLPHHQTSSHHHSSGISSHLTSRNSTSDLKQYHTVPIP